MVAGIGWKPRSRVKFDLVDLAWKRLQVSNKAYDQVDAGVRTVPFWADPPMALGVWQTINEELSGNGS